MSQLKVRKVVVNLETTYHEGGTPPDAPLVVGVAAAVVNNPFAGRYHQDIQPLMNEMKPLARDLCQRLLQALGGDCTRIQVFGKGAIVGVNGELEHGALWHAPGGHALRDLLKAKSFVPSGKMVGATGSRVMIPLLYVNSVWVRSHFGVAELTIHDAPRPDELMLAVAMGTGGRIHARSGGLTMEEADRGLTL